MLTCLNGNLMLNSHLIYDMIAIFIYFVVKIKDIKNKGGMVSTKGSSATS